MKGIAVATRAVLRGVLTIGITLAPGCGSHDQPNDAARNVGKLTIPLVTTVGATTYRLDAVFVISGAQGAITLATNAADSVLSTTLPAGSYSALLQSFTLYKQDGTGALQPVSAMAVSNSQSFTVFVDSTTTVNFQFETQGGVVTVSSGNVDITFTVAETACNPISVDPAPRTVQSQQFFVDFSNNAPSDPEEIDVLRWAGGPNLVGTIFADTCTQGLSFFGNAWTPPDAQSGGWVMVGAGSTGTWEHGDSSILIHSVSSGCVPSTSIPVETRYGFKAGLGADTIEVDRTFDFGSTPFDHALRPFIPHIVIDFDRVIYPNATGTSLQSISTSFCNGDCVSDWNGSWFAFYASGGARAGQGMIILRRVPDPSVRLWIDEDGTSPASNASSMIILPPPGGFVGQVREEELLCFFDAHTWSPADQSSLKLPQGCTFDLACNAGSATACDPNPCQHGGTCSAIPNECACPPGIRGSNCELVFTELAAAEFHACGLRNDGSVACWGGLFRGAGDAPAIPFKQITVGTLHGCGIRSSDDGITCWGDNSVGQASPPSGSFQSIAAGGYYTCAVSSGGTLLCWGNVTTPPAGVYSSVGPAGVVGRICAIRADGMVTCFGESTGSGSQPPPGAFMAVASDAFESCGITNERLIACWDLDGRQAQPPSGTFNSLSLGFGSGCAIRTDGTLACWGEDTAGDTVPPSGSFKHLAVGDGFACAVRADDQVTCWGSNDWGQLIPP